MEIIEAINETIWLRGLAGELHTCQGETIAHCDSQSAIRLTKVLCSMKGLSMSMSIITLL